MPASAAVFGRSTKIQNYIKTAFCVRFGGQSSCLMYIGWCTSLWNSETVAQCKRRNM